MRRVFTKFLGSRVNPDDLTVDVRLADGLGASEEVSLTPDIVDAVAQGLMIEKAKAQLLHEEGVPTGGPIGEPVRTVAMRLGALEARLGLEPGDRPVLILVTELGAEYAFSFPPEYADRVKQLGSRSPS